MATTNFSLGRDCQVVLMGPFGRVDISHVTGFEAKQVTHPIRVDRLDGTQLAAELPKGWEGSFDIERGDSTVDDFVAKAEQAYYTGGSMAYGTLYQYVTETDGSTSTYQFDSAVFKLTSSGAWKGDASVKQKLEFFAARRTRI
ncbi:MAG TPA: hypothetical protein VME92_12135 [Acetobacteraceae bacterium]|nr:hypothetical protein [Acetobacteraceae bacterium]